MVFASALRSDSLDDQLQPLSHPSYYNRCELIQGNIAKLSYRRFTHSRPICPVRQEYDVHGRASKSGKVIYLCTYPKIG
jgi:hypothetical protein